MSRLADNHVRARWAAEGRHEKVIALALLGCEEWPNDHWRVQQLAVAYEGAGRWKDAASSWESAIAVAKATLAEAQQDAVVARYERRLAEVPAKAGLPRAPSAGGSGPALPALR